jgi:hypothetical protein
VANFDGAAPQFPAVISSAPVMAKPAWVLIVLCGTSAAALADGALSGRVTDLTDRPVADASVVITGPDGGETRVTTDAAGRYTATVPGGGSYTVVFASGQARGTARVDIPGDGAAVLNSQLETGGEVIELQGHSRPLVYARPRADPLVIPRYSDEAVLSDHWTRAWLLLDIDERGVVMRAKFVKRPGYQLDAIALQHVFGIRFDPARDQYGVPARSYIVWSLEWPSMSWLAPRNRVGRRLDGMTRMVQLDPGVTLKTRTGIRVEQLPPCQGQAPMNLDNDHPILRDCSTPDLSKADASEPWVDRDPSLPIPVAPEAPVIDPAKLYADQDALAAHNHRMAIITAGSSAAFAVAAIVTYSRLGGLSARVDADQADHVSFDPVKLDRDQARLTRWELGTAGLAVGAVVSACASWHYWSHSTAVSIQATADGATLSYGGAF